MATWEYTVATWHKGKSFDNRTGRDGLMGMLAQHGNAGWDLVTSTLGDDDEVWCVFKQPQSG